VARGYPDYRYFSFPVSVAEGGTGVGTLTLYGVLLGNGTSQVIASAAGNPYEVLRVPNVGGFPAFGAVDLGQAAAVTGLLPVAHGGWGSSDGSYPQTITPTVASGTPHLNLLTTGEANPTLRLERKSITFGPGGDVAPYMQLYFPTSLILWLRNNSTDPTLGEATELAIKANATAGKEATLSLVRGDDVNQEYMDITNNGYATDTNYWLRIGKGGTGVWRNFNCSYWDGASNNYIWKITPTPTMEICCPLTLDTPLAVASGGTGTASGSITGTGALTFAAGGTDQNVNILPSGAGAVVFPGAFVEPPGSYVSGSGLFRSYDGDVELWANGAGPYNVILTPAGAGKVTTTKQIETTLATGTAPLAVTSTTLVSNLNAERVAGTQVTNAATSGALLLGSGTGTAAWGTPDGARVYNSISLTIATATNTYLTFDTERYDNGGLHDTTSNTSRLTAQKAGKYLISAHVSWGISATGYRQASLVVNRTDKIAGATHKAVDPDYDEQSISTVYHLAAADYVEVQVRQTSGGDLAVNALTRYSPEFAMQWLGP